MSTVSYDRKLNCYNQNHADQGRREKLHPFRFNLGQFIENYCSHFEWWFYFISVVVKNYRWCKWGLFPIEHLQERVFFHRKMHRFVPLLLKLNYYLINIIFPLKKCSLLTKKHRQSYFLNKKTIKVFKNKKSTKVIFRNQKNDHISNWKWKLRYQ